VRIWWRNADQNIRMLQAEALQEHCDCSRCAQGKSKVGWGRHVDASLAAGNESLWAGEKRKTD